LIGLDGSNPLAFLAALGTLRGLSVIARKVDRPAWLSGGVRLAWGTDGLPTVAVLHLAERAEPDELCTLLADRLVRDLSAHPMNRAVEFLGSGVTSREMHQRIRAVATDEREQYDWLMALYSDVAPEAASQLQMVRRDYLIGNLRSVLSLADSQHFARTLFQPWDYADPLNNQSLHWDPSEDRRHAYQWHQPNGDPTRNRRGGMLGANRLAIEAWPLFVSVGTHERMRTRGFSGTRSTDTYWTWPIWSQPLCANGITSMLALSAIQDDEPCASQLRAFGVTCAFRSQRILVGKTPNLTPAYAV
jgi:CRISPR-associated endonuclease/helicase Cas3